MLKRSMLRPGMKVENVVSHQIGVVRGSGKKLMRAHHNYVQVRIPKSTKNSRPRNNCWWLEHVRLAPKGR